MRGIHRMRARAGSACRTNRSAIRRNEKGDRLARSGQLGYQLLELGLRPGAGGAGPDVSLRAEGERVFRHVVAVGRVDDDEEIVVAGGEIDLLDLDPQLLGELAGGLRPLGSLLDRTDALVGPAQRQDERRHAVLHGLVFPRRGEAAREPARLRVLGSAQKLALNSGMRCPPAARSRPIEIGTKARHARSKGGSCHRYTQSMIPKSWYRFSEKIMLKQEARAGGRFKGKSSRSSGRCPQWRALSLGGAVGTER